VAIFRDIGAPARLTRLVEGESLLNDATAIAIFAVLLGYVTAGREPDAGAVLAGFARSFGGGLLVGFVAARSMVALLPLVRDIRAAEMTLTSRKQRVPAVRRALGSGTVSPKWSGGLTCT
jgi:monovalent cation:H+ antiporter, CPA1 family